MKNFNNDYDYDRDLMVYEDAFYEKSEVDDSPITGLDDIEDEIEDIEDIYEAISDEEEDVVVDEVVTKTVDEPYDIKNHSLLNDDETLDYLKKAQAGDKTAQDILVERNIRLVKSVAKQFPSKSIISKNDLIQEGVIGLMKSIARFDVNRGIKFSTYAHWWVRQAMQRALADNGKAIKVPVYLQEELLRIKKVQKSLEQKLNRTASVNEIAEELKVDCSSYKDIVNHDYFENLLSTLNLDSLDERKEIESIILEDLGFNPDAEIVLKSICEFAKKKHKTPSIEEVNKDVNLDVKKIKSILQTDANSNVASLNVPANDDFDSCYGDNIASDVNLEQSVSQNAVAEGLLKALDEVYGAGEHSLEYYIKTHSNVKGKNYDPKGEKFIPWNELMKYRYGIGGYQKETLEQLGQRYNISRERVRQIEKSILGNEVDKEGKGKKYKRDCVIFRKKIKEYCGFDVSDFS